MKEREISLRDLFAEILLHWRRIIVCMLAGAVILGIFSSVQAYRMPVVPEGTKENTRKTDSVRHAGNTEYTEGNIETSVHSMSKAEREQEQKRLESVLTDAQAEHASGAAAYQVLYQDALAFCKQSLWMQMDPQKVQKAELTFGVTSADRNSCYEAERVYEDFVRSAELAAYAAKHTGSSADCMAQAVSLSRGSEGLLEGCATFQVKIVHFDKALCKNTAQAVRDFLLKKQKSLAQERTVGSHDIALISESYTETADSGVLEQQKKIRSGILEMQAEQAKYLDAFTEPEQAYYDFLVALKTERDEGQDQDKDKEQDKNQVQTGSTEDGMQPSGIRGVTGIFKGVRIRYVLTGMVLAAFIYAGCIFLRYVLDEKIRVSDNLMELYGIAQLGILSGQPGYCRRFAFVDQWIYDFRNRGRQILPKEEEAVRILAASVKMAAVKQNIHAVCLVSCGRNESIRTVCQEVKQELEDMQGCTRISLLENVLCDADALCHLEQAQGVVLAVQAGVSRCSEAAQELELLRRLEIPVLGGIMME